MAVAQLFGKQNAITGVIFLYELLQSESCIRVNPCWLTTQTDVIVQFQLSQNMTPRSPQQSLQCAEQAVAIEADSFLQLYALVKH